MEEAIQDFLEYFHREAPSRLSSIVSDELGDALELDSERQRLLDRAIDAAVITLVQRMENERSGLPQDNELAGSHAENDATDCVTEDRSHESLSQPEVIGAREVSSEPFGGVYENLHEMSPEDPSQPLDSVMDLDDFIWTDLEGVTFTPEDPTEAEMAP